MTVVETVELRLAEFLKANPEGGRINGHELASDIFQKRQAEGFADSKQTQDYTLFVLRERPNVCRHSIGDGLYVVHPETECSPKCKVKWPSVAGEKLRGFPPCPDCGFPIPLSGECGYC